MKKVLFIAAALCAVMFAVAGCEKNPGGNGNDGGNGDNGGDGNDGGETVVAKPAKSFTVVDSDDLPLLQMSFTNDDKGRVVNADVKTRPGDDYLNPNLDETHNINMEYDENSIKFVTDEDYITEDYTLENGLPTKCIVCWVVDWYTIYTEYKYRYDEAGYLVEIECNGDDDELDSKTLLEWKDGCIESIFINYYYHNISEEYVFYYNEMPSTISNFNPLTNPLINHFFSKKTHYGESINMYLFNILGKQSKYLPIKCEYRGKLDPDDPESVLENTTKFEYELNDDKTVSKVKVTFEEYGETGECYYKFAY